MTRAIQYLQLGNGVEGCLKPGPRPRSVAEHLEAKSMPEPNSGCQLWTGNVDMAGYGALTLGSGGPKKAHRLSWEMAHGPIPNGLHVLHKCDVPSCINPSHLFLGTQVDNNRDKGAKGRQAKGEQHGMSKLTLQDVGFIRGSALPSKKLAQMLGVVRHTVQDVRRGKTWR